MADQSDIFQARILLVDDNQLNLDLLATVLRRSGYQAVDLTTDPCAVIGLHRAKDYDLILLDLNMPTMDGFEVLAALRNLVNGPCLPVLAISAAREYKLRSLQAGAMDFIAKPFQHDELLARVGNLLEMRLRYQRRATELSDGAASDLLTGLPRRLLFEQMVGQAIAAGVGQASAMLLLDLDGLRRISDTIETSYSDQLLLQCSQRLAAWAPTGCLLGRFDSAEFGIYLPHAASAHEAVQAAEAILASCSQPCFADGEEFSLTAHIGIALRPADGDNAATLIKHAGQALHEARQQGNGCYRLYQEAMNLQTRQRLDLERALRKACSNGEFELYYQPKVEISSGNMVGAEALLRWNRPGHGLVVPNEFIPVLEQTGLILQVGAWVIDQACRQIKAWSTLHHRPLQIAVNVASRQFAESDIDRVVGDALERHGVDGALLSLEVTESALMEDTVRAAATLAAVRARGVKVAIDDFGTGHSSLAYLKHFQVDTLKIDRAFVRDLVSDRGDAVLVDAILSLAHSLKIEVVAEGVETAEQLAYLARRRCDQIQGYYFSKPLPLEKFERLVRANIRLATSHGAPEPLQRTLLIVDDEPHVLAALERLFRQDGYKILTAQGAAQGFHLLAQHQVQLILCDQRMEEMSGTEFLDQVKDMYPDTYRIILSGYSELSTIIDAINRGALYRYFTKPWSNQELRDNIRSAFVHYWQQHGLPQPAHLSAEAQ